MKAKGYLMAIIGSVSYGLIPLFVLPLKYENFPVESILFYRFIIGALMLLPYVLLKKESLKINWKEFANYSILGLMFAASSKFLFLGYDYSSPGVASTILFIYPVIVALIMSAFYKERLGKAKIIALIITTVGVFILSLKGDGMNINFLGVFFSVLSAFCYAVYIVIINKAKLSGSGFKITYYSILFSSVYFFFFVHFFERSLKIPNVFSFFDLLLFAFVTIVISMTALVYAIKWIGATPAAIMGALEPVVAVAISVFIFQEQMTLNLIIGIVVILFGVILNVLSGKKSDSESADN